MTQQTSISNRAWAELLLLAVIWGGVFLAVTVALSEVGVFTMVALRVIGGTVVLWGYILARGLNVPKSLKIWVAFLVMGLLNNVIPFSLIAWGQLRIESGLSAIINGSTAIFGVLVAAAVFSDERLTPNRLVGVSFGFLGLAVAIGFTALRSFDLTSLAQLAVIGASVSYAFAGAWARKQLKGLAPQVASAGMTGFSALILGILALFVDGIPTFDYTLPVDAALFYMAVIGTAMAYLLYYRVLATAGSGNLMLVTLLISPVAIILGAVVLGEALQPRAFFGFAILAVGMLILDGRVLKYFKRSD
ncbi:MAG: DMT family transporter [Paracoccaceae bacterium]